MRDVLISDRRNEFVKRDDPNALGLHVLGSGSLEENQIGGSWTVISEQAKAAERSGIMPHCLVSPSNAPEEFIKDANLLNLSAASFHFPIPENEGQPDLIFQGSILDKYVDRLLSIANKRDILYSHMALAGAVNLEVAQNMGIPHAFIPHALEIMSAENFPDRALKSLRLIAEYALAKNASFIITNTQYEADYYARHYSRLPSDPVNADILSGCKGIKTVLQNYALDDLVLEKVGGQLPTYDDIRRKCVPNFLGVDPVKFSPERRATLREVHRNEFCEEVAIPSDAIIVGSVGRYHPQKDQITAIRAFKDAYDRLPSDLKEKTYLVFVGPGASEANTYFCKIQETVEEVCPEQRNRIFFRNAASADVMNSIFDIRLDATSFETFGLATAEALMAGCPTVMVSNPVYEEIYDGRGLNLIKLPDRLQVGELGDALGRLIISGQTRENYGRLCHDAVKDLTWEVSVKRLNSAFQDVLK